MRLTTRVAAHVCVFVCMQLSMKGAQQQMKIAAMIAEAGFDDVPVIRDLNRSAAEQVIIDRVLPLARILVPRHLDRVAAGAWAKPKSDGESAESIADGDGNADGGSDNGDADTHVAENYVQHGSPEHLLLLALEGTFHFSVFGTRELLVHGLSSSMFTDDETADVAQCGIENDPEQRKHVSRVAVLCAQRPVVHDLVDIIAFQRDEDQPTADLSAVDVFKQTAVHVAAKYGDADSTHQLVRNHASIVCGYVSHCERRRCLWCM